MYRLERLATDRAHGHRHVLEPFRALLCRNDHFLERDGALGGVDFLSYLPRDSSRRLSQAKGAGRVSLPILGGIVRSVLGQRRCCVRLGKYADRVVIDKLVLEAAVVQERLQGLLGREVPDSTACFERLYVLREINELKSAVFCQRA